MNTCKTCIFWQKDVDEKMFNEIVHPYRPGTYDLERMTEEETIELHGYPLRYCKHPKILFYQRPEIDGATVIDGSEYKACFVTAPDFGCVLHKENENSISTSEHVCGLQGYDPMIDPPCPGCTRITDDNNDYDFYA